MRAVVLLVLFNSISIADVGLILDPACDKINRRAVGLFIREESIEAAAILDRFLSLTPKTAANAFCRGITLDNLAAFAQRKGAVNETETYAKLSIRELETDPMYAPVLIRPLEVLTAVYLEKGFLGQARSTLHRIEELPDLGIADRAVVHGLHASILQGMGNLRESESEYLDAIRDWELSGKPDARARALSEQINLARLYIQMSQYSSAEHLLTSAQNVLQRATSDPEGQRIQILDSLAALFARQGKIQAAEKSLHLAIQLAAVRPADSRMNAQLYRSYAAVLRAAHRKKEAVGFDAKALALEGTQPGAMVDVSQLGANTHTPHE